MSLIFKEKVLDINVPLFWDKSKVIKTLINAKSTDELMEFFGCSNRMAFARMMKPIFPDKPANMTYITYIQSLIQLR